MTPIRDLLIVHHSHTDIGYTNYQDNVFALQRAYLRRAMDLAEQYADGAPGEQFKWTNETTVLTDDFIRHASDAEIKRLQKLHRAGQIGFGGMYCNLTPLAPTDLLARSLLLVETLRRDYGFDIQHGMNCDVNGQHWGLVELLLDAGFKGFSMAINRVMGRNPQPRPRGFRWAGPSGRTLLTWHGETYGYGHTLGIPRGQTPRGWQTDIDAAYPRVQDYVNSLIETGYTYDFIMFQITSTFMWDNGGPQEELVQFVREWNRRGWTPRLNIVRLDEFFARLNAQPDLPTLTGDWTDWWAQGVGSSAFETALNRQSHTRYFTAAALDALLHGQPQHASPDSSDSEQAWRDLLLYDEHTWGSHNSIMYPSSADSRGQGYRKLLYAYDGAAATARFWQAAQHDLAARLPQNNEPRVVVFNPLPWARRVPLYLPAINPTGWENDQLERSLELSAPQSEQARRVDYGIVDLPACGYTALPLRVEAPDDPGPEALGSAEAMADHNVQPVFTPRAAPGLHAHTDVTHDGWTLENSTYRLRLDSVSGAIASLIDKATGKEWVDPSAAWGLGHYVYETNRSPRGRRDTQVLFANVPDWDHQPALAPLRRGPERVRKLDFVPGICQGRLSAQLDAPGAADVRMQVVLYDDLPWIDLVYDIDKTAVAEMESVYIAFPFALDRPTPHYESGGAIVEAEAQQLPYASRDFYSIQHWVDLSDGAGGVTVATPDAPMIHLGGFTNHKYLPHMQMEQPYLLSWAANNHWFTNFQVSQSGWMRFRYRLLPHAGPFDPVAATRFGAEAAIEPLCGPVWDRPSGLTHRAFPFAPHLPEEASFLAVEPDNVHLIGLKAAADGGGIILRLQELSGKASDFALRFNLSRVQSAARCTLTEVEIGALAVDGNRVTGHIDPYRIETVRVRLDS
jgi:alpha-mannosidase